ncbi:MAG: Mut7-C RNAse domain-containing protein [Candidatus Edwardsbacteria bacterium]
MKFLVDSPLGKLAKFLRACGFDTEYFGGMSAFALVKRAQQEKRTVITTNPKLSENPPIKVVMVKEGKPKSQLQTVIEALNINLATENFFSRCLLCNTEVEKIDGEKAKDLVPLKVFETFSEFWHCPKCDKIYWHGSHWENMKKRIFLKG